MSAATAGDAAMPVADAETKALFVESTGDDVGWLGFEGSYFIEGVRAGRKESKAAIAERDARIAVLEQRIAELEKSE